MFCQVKMAVRKAKKERRCTPTGAQVMNPKFDNLAKHVWIDAKSPKLVFHDAESTVDYHDTMIEASAASSSLS